MKPWILRGTTAAIALFAANTALADVTPEEVWQNWQDQYTSVGSTVTTGSVARDGDTLVVKDLTATAKTEFSTSDTKIPELRLKDLGDGTVEVTVGGDMTIATTGTATADTPATAMTGTMKAPGMVTIASGTPDAINYDMTAPELEMAMTITEAEDGPGSVTVRLAGSTGKYLVSGPVDAKVMDGSFAAQSASMLLDVSGPEGPAKGSFNAADVAMTFKGNFVGVDMEKASEAFAKGFAVDTAVTFGAASYEMDMPSPDAPGRIVGGSEGGQFSMAMDKTRMMFAGGGRNVTMTMTGMGLPFPEAKLSYAESGFNLTMPVGKSDTPSDFAFLSKIVDLSISDEIWGMLDPTGQLPHDPATLVIDTKGTARLTTDIMDEAAMAALGDVPPGELHSLDVTEIKAKLAGAELTGSGAFTFDNSDLVTFGGMPAPTGKLDLRLLGGNTLLDKLQAMGLLSEDDVMGARMMMSMFGNAVAGTDEITSTIEAKDKHIYVNGQMIQ